MVQLIWFFLMSSPGVKDINHNAGSMFLYKIAVCHLKIFGMFTWKTSKFPFLGKLIFEVKVCRLQVGKVYDVAQSKVFYQKSFFCNQSFRFAACIVCTNHILLEHQELTSISSDPIYSMSIEARFINKISDFLLYYLQWWSKIYGPVTSFVS